jgi:hypothetical protein
MWVSAAAMLDTVPNQICKKLPQKQGAEQGGGPQVSSDRRELLREREGPRPSLSQPPQSRRCDIAAQQSQWLQKSDVKLTFTN